MGATVSTNKLAAAFTANNGKIFYVLFEESFEKNCHPHTPSWCCVAIGELAQVLRVIFISGSSCEGGMRKGAGGRDITPEGYIAGWLKQLANPVEFTDRPIELESSDSWRSTVPKEQLAKVCEKLNKVGHADVATALEAGQKVQVSLFEDAELLSGMYDSILLGAWRVIGDTPLYANRVPELGHLPTKAKGGKQDLPRFYKVSPRTADILIEGSDGQWRCEGWAYSYVASFVAGLWEAELSEPGSYRARIKAYRDAIKSADLIPKQGVKVVVDTTVTLEKYQERAVRGLIADAPHILAGSDVQFDVPEDDHMLFRVTNLPPKCTTWSITERSPAKQQSLLA